MNLHGIDHVGLTVPDLDRATEFLVDALGAEVLYDTHTLDEPARDSDETHRRLGIPVTMAQRAIRMLGLPNGPGIELFEYQGPDQHGAAVPSDIGWEHIGVYVDDVDAALARVEAAGGSRNADPRDLSGAEGGTGNRFVYARTPWGSTIELISYPSPQPYLENAPRPKWSVAEVPQRITGRTELLALLADPIRHSHSPRMHDLALAKLGLDYASLAFEVDSDGLEAAVAGLRALKVRGWNVSMPHKRAMVGLLTVRDRSVELTGSCNTVVVDDGVLTGYNTDGIGWTRALRENHVEVAGATITIIGAGGAATAMAAQAALEGAGRILVVNRRDAFFDDGGATLAGIAAATGVDVSLSDLDDEGAFAAAVAESSVLANATGVGMGSLVGVSPVRDAGILRPDLFVSDVVYSPARTALLAQAEAAGCRTMNGLPMMFHQGAASFELFTGHAMPLDYVRERMSVDLAARSPR